MASIGRRQFRLRAEEPLRTDFCRPMNGRRRNTPTTKLGHGFFFLSTKNTEADFESAFPANSVGRSPRL